MEARRNVTKKYYLANFIKTVTVINSMYPCETGTLCHP